MKTRNRIGKRNNRGFTLVELMVVVVILGLLATVVGTNVIPMLFESRRETAKMDISTIAEAVELYQMRNGIPDDLEVLITPDDNGNTILKNFTSVPTDPWGNEYVIEPDPDRRNGFIIRSYGEDGEAETEDDITNLNMRDKNEEDR